MTVEQKQRLKKLKKPGHFRPGRAGCEATLYVIKGYFSTDFCMPVKDDEEERRQSIIRVAAVDLQEVMRHMVRWEEDFDIRSITSVGLITLLSGSPTTDGTVD